ncbi:MAG: hypothetical protein OEN49_06585 [Gammaproteobacteria bacterium]|nr:hypothetical protein [Gammaproteobacteria bacterium]MDH3371367.1 hypothetical protein [Gammaproteobacteria bacterium]MDH3563045.1 hypothetical protein [Gammaproteobacteria bacterium]MDH5486902.1 hypothetical protein [Gammaproteobacteria bacterium]
MRALLGALLVVSAYVVIYYRLLVKHFYEKHLGVRESTFGALFSFPPYRVLPEAGKKYARRYWVATAFMVSCVVALTWLTDFSAWRNLDAGF